MTFSDEMTLAAARDELRRLVDDGHHCPCCTQLAKVYRRKIHATMARDLVRIYRRHGREWFHLPTAHGGHTGDFAKLAHWGLAEEEPERRDDGGRAGYWRITPHGVAWIERRATVPKYAHLYDGRALRFSGDPVTIDNALGERFRYDDLMAA